ncbi:MAG: hypothetical protein JSW32_00810 [Deltaproteobacteria bacterium]|nr:MAG: hypothetical protein JSW32_00810 [Deltaproteobacteria bacterium]
MKARKIWWLVAVFTLLLLASSCLPWGKKKDEEKLYKEGKEGRWVYSERRPSPYGEEKKAVTYSKRPYGAKEGEEEVAPSKPIITPYLIGRLKYKVVMVEFQDETKGDRRGLGSIVSQELAKQLEQSGMVVLVDMEVVKKSLGSWDLQLLKDPTSLWKLKTLLGVHGLVIGSIKDVMVGTGEKQKGGEALAVTKIEAKLLDTETGNIIRSVKGENPIFTSLAVGEFSRDKALIKAINFALQGIKEGIIRGLAGLEWSTSVASVEGDKVYLNAGKSSGLKVGDVLEAFGPGKEIEHPVTKVSLGRIPGKMKGKIKIARFFGFDVSEADVTSGGEVAAGDIVRLAK